MGLRIFRPRVIKMPLFFHTESMLQDKILKLECTDMFFVLSFLFFRMYDVDGNGVIDQDEMTKIVQAIYDMLGAGATKPTDSAEDRAKNIFRYINRLNMSTRID